MNGAVSKVNKKFISHLTRAQLKPSAAATVQVSPCATSSLLLMLTAGPRGQFPRWRRVYKITVVMLYKNTVFMIYKKIIF